MLLFIPKAWSSNNPLQSSFPLMASRVGDSLPWGHAYFLSLLKLLVLKFASEITSTCDVPNKYHGCEPIWGAGVLTVSWWCTSEARTVSSAWLLDVLVQSLVLPESELWKQDWAQCASCCSPTHSVLWRQGSRSTCPPHSSPSAEDGTPGFGLYWNSKFLFYRSTIYFFVSSSCCLGLDSRCQPACMVSRPCPVKLDWASSGTSYREALLLRTVLTTIDGSLALSVFLGLLD